MRLTFLVPCLVVASWAGSCGDDPKPAGANAPGVARIDAADARLVGLHEQALMLRARGQYAQALAVLDELTKLDPSDLNVRFNRATVLADLGRPQEAMALYDELLKLTPNDPQLWWNRAAVLLDLGRAEEALIELDRARAAIPDATVLRTLRAETLSRLGRAQESLVELDQADRLLASSPEAARNPMVGARTLLARVEALEALGRAADGAVLLERLRSEYQSQPFFAELMRKRGR
jgi:tetratricopeptide (TPR) repeat protein